MKASAIYDLKSAKFMTGYCAVNLDLTFAYQVSVLGLELLAEVRPVDEFSTLKVLPAVRYVYRNIQLK
jgi:hypothetical protein